MSKADDVLSDLASKDGVDPEAVREKYRRERDKRLNKIGHEQYILVKGAFKHFADDPNSERIQRDPIIADVEILIIGAGLGGLTVGAKLRRAGFQDIRLLDNAGDVGGTWYWNRFPGSQCDIDSYIYLPLLEETGYIPTQKYVDASEILNYMRRIAVDYDLYRDAMFQTHAKELRWLEEEQRWLVKTDRLDELKARYVVSVTGPMPRPKLPGIPGIKDFKGHAFHSSRWDYDYTGGDEHGGLHKLTDKRVAIVGTGASAIQVVPYLGEYCEHLYVIQRTPSSVSIRGQQPTDMEWAKSLQPGWQTERRLNFLTMVTGGYQETDLVADSWTDIFRSVMSFMPVEQGEDRTPEEIAAIMELADMKKMNEVRERIDSIVEDPTTAERLKPWYRMWCKRPAFSDTYLATFNRPNVTLVSTDGRGVERITADAICVDGVTYPVDCLIFATGFEVGISYTARAGYDEIYGRGGQSLSEFWRDGMKTMHGFYSHGFPNLFHVCVGQNSAGTNFNDIATEHGDHIADVLSFARDKGLTLVEPTQAAQDEWVATCRLKEVDRKAFHAECTPSYLNNEGHFEQRGGFRSEEYGGGPLDFIRIIRQWRAAGFPGLAGVEE